MDKANIILTGGHAATTAIAVIKEIQSRNLDWKLYWVGPKSAMEGKLVPTLASKIMPHMGINYIPITTGRLQRKLSLYTIPSLLKIPYGFIDALKIINKLKPQIVISFGGFASVPVCFAAWISRIPVITHEQTVAVGRANAINAFLAKKILIAREESKKYLPINKTILVGNPVSAKFYNSKPNTISTSPSIYITGGSSGAQRINNVIAEILFELLKKYKIIHQTGMLDFEKFKKLREDFPSDLKSKYEVHEFIDPEDVPSVFKHTSLIISRAGANTLSEIMAAKIPAILIPIPWASYDEQTQNAKMVAKTGLATVVEEKDLTPDNLLNKIDYLINHRKSIINESDYTLAELDRKAAQKFVNEIHSSLSATMKV